MSQRRVVVTGMGAVSPFGVGVDPLWEGIIDGRSTTTSITLFDASKFSVRIGGEVKGFDAAHYIDRKIVKRLDRYAQFAVVAATEAAKSANLDLNVIDPAHVAIIFGSGIGGINELEQQFQRLSIKGPDKVSAFTIPKLMINAASGNISIALGAKGKSITVATACASATNAMGEAFREIREGRADVVVTGGSEAALTELALAGFAAMKALSARNDEPARASRPFDADRDGFVLSEGAGALVFEDLEHAQKRGAPVLAEIIGFASTCDAEHIAQPSENGKGAADSMRLALIDARINPDDVDYINAHATGTPLGDVAETIAIKSVFGPKVNPVVSSTKGALGHSLGASGGIEMALVIRALQHSVIPPTINLDTPGEGCDLDYCPNTARDHKMRIAMNNSFGFGGHNASIVVRRFE